MLIELKGFLFGCAKLPVAAIARQNLNSCHLPSCSQLYAPMPIMIWIAALIEGIIQNWADFGILIGIQFVNASLGW